MRVLLIIEGTYPWYRGGVSEWVFRYLTHLSDFSFSIVQIATDEFQGLDPHQALYPIPDNVKDFKRIPPPDFSQNECSNMERWYEKINEQLQPFISKNNLVHVTNTGFAGWLGAQISRDSTLPMLLTEHAIYWKEVEMGAVALECGYKIPTDDAGKAEKVTEFKKLAEETYKRADKTLSVSKVNIPFQKELGAADSTYIPNGISASWLVEDKKRDTEPTIGWVGRCAAMKNPLAFLDLVEAFQSLELNPSFKMIICEANEPELEKAVQNRAQKYPQLECIWNEKAKPYYRNLDILSITSLNESQPLVMLEALAHKVLPVGAKVGDFTDKFGITFSEGATKEQIVGQMQALWNKPSQFLSAVEKRFEQVRDFHTWEYIFDRYRDIMNNLGYPEGYSKYGT